MLLLGIRSLSKQGCAGVMHWHACKDSNASFSYEVLQIYNKAEDSMEKGILMWEEVDQQHLNEISWAQNLWGKKNLSRS